MAGETPITIVGNLTADPELRFTPSGAAVANFTVASTPRTFDRQTNEFKDGETLFMRCSVWREQAENISESLTRGTRVVVTGRLVSRSWEKDGENRTVMEMQVDEVGPSLRYATARVTKAQRGQGGQGGGQGNWGGQGGQGGQGNWGGQQGAGGAGGGQGTWGGQGAAPSTGSGGQGGAGGQQAPETDPWATGGASSGNGGAAPGGAGGAGGGQGGGWGGAPSYDEPPF